MSIDTSVGRVEGVRVSIDTSVQVSGQGSVKKESLRWRVNEGRGTNVAWLSFSVSCGLCTARVHFVWRAPRLLCLCMWCGKYTNVIAMFAV